MLLLVLKATAAASLVTALFAFKFVYWRRPWLLAIYFAFFWVSEVIVDIYFLPPGIFGTGAIIMCFALTGLIVAVTYGVHQYEKRHSDR
jgi:hypothetical protein